MLRTTDSDPAMSDLPYDKSALRKGRSYPLKRIELEECFDEKVRDSIFNMTMATAKGNSEKWVFTAYFTGEGRGGYSAGKAYITFFSVRTERREEVHDVLISRGLPRLREWLVAMSAAGEGWRLIDHSLIFQFDEDKLVFIET
jgi:hypothetical protein